MLQFDLEKHYGEFSLKIAGEVKGEWLVLLAPSGAGKSLALNLISGITRPERGFVRLNGETLFDSGKKINRPIRQRRIGYLFQDYALFPHMTVAANIAYGLPRGVEAHGETKRWMSFFQLEGRERAYPRQLSGGQRQRVALARTLASKPRALLLDEPFSALDRRTRETLYREVARLKEELTLPVILVTHDFNEARLLGDKVAVLEEGRVLETGAKERIFARPRRHETARFLGVENVHPARVLASEPHGPAGQTPPPQTSGRRYKVESRGLTLEVLQEEEFSTNGVVHLCIHASDVRLLLDRDERPNALSVRIGGLEPHGGANLLRLHPLLPGEETGARGIGVEAATFLMLVDDYVIGRHGLVEGRTVSVWLPPEKLFICE